MRKQIFHEKFNIFFVFFCALEFFPESRLCKFFKKFRRRVSGLKERYFLKIARNY